jgi:hypothetical protein
MAPKEQKLKDKVLKQVYLKYFVVVIIIIIIIIYKV